MAPALGIQISTSIDLTRPTVIMESSPGLDHVRFDLGAFFGLPPDTGAPVSMELWLTPERIVLDTRSLADVFAATPSINRGPMDASVSYVDVNAIGATSQPLTQALTGSPLPDRPILTRRLPEVLDQLTLISERPTRYRGTTDQASYVEAMGGDLEASARTASAALALNADVDVDGLTQAYVDFFHSVTTEVIVEVDDLGSVRSVSTRADLSSIYRFLFDEARAATFGLSPADARDASQALRDTIWRLETTTTFEPRDQLAIPPPPPTDVDRTAAWRDFLLQSGAIRG